MDNIIFNILDCFDENIPNLDITKNYIYVLMLVENKYYVGRTGNILQRITEHFTCCGSLYTMTYKPIKVIEVIEELTREDERNKTLETMEKYGWENVRGAGWCSLKINKPKLKLNKKVIKPPKNFEINDNDLEIKRLYCIENKSVIEIGKIYKRSASWIANRLEKMKVLERKQLALGFNEYICSDEFKLKIKNYNDNRRQFFCEKIRQNENIKTNVNLTNIKQTIREKILNTNSVSYI